MSMRRKAVMHRRAFIAGAAALAASGRALAQPAIGGKARALIHVPQANLTSLDPVWTPALVTRNFAAMVYETLYGRDEQLVPRPLMLDGDLVEDDGRRRTMRLRDGLVFHDGTRVLARDCVASLQRWMKRDAIGQTIAARLDALEAPDDRTLVWRLNKPFAQLPYVLAKTQSTPVIMPERLANTDPFKQVTEVVGSGPFRFLAGEYVSGDRAAFQKFDGYVPRDEPPSFCAGGHKVHLDRVEWRIMPDPATAANALMKGEVDWVDQPLADLLPLLRKAAGVTVGPIDIYGTYGLLRPNFLHGATTNAGVRRAMLAAIDQVEVMTAVMGGERALYRAPVGYFLPGTASASDTGMDFVRKRRGTGEIAAMLTAAGYGGERVVLMHPTDQTSYDAMSSVVTASLRKVGINVDDQAMDWGTVVQRRASVEPLEKGGWSLYTTGAPAPDYRDPVVATNLRGSGRSATFGWPTNAKIEALREAWLDSRDEAEQRKLASDMQAEAFDFVPFIPLGQYFPPSAWRSNLTGLLKGAVPVFWNVERT
jgi:peptide/nickel transport system substrate-binding protein